MRAKAKWGIGIGIALLGGLAFLLRAQPDYPFVDGCYAVVTNRSDLPTSSFGAKQLQHYVCFDSYDAVARRVSAYARERGGTGEPMGNVYQISRTVSSSGSANLMADMTVDVRLDFEGRHGKPDRVTVSVWDFSENWVTRLRRAFRLK